MSVNSSDVLPDIRNFVSESEYKYIQELEKRRMQRNTDILAKIQELKITASVHTARSLQFQNIRNEYEGVVRKYKENKHAAAFTTKVDNYSSYSAAPWKTETAPAYPYSTLRSTVSAGDQPQEKVLASIGCNTDLTGPVQAITDTEEPKDSIQTDTPKIDPVPVQQTPRKEDSQLRQAGKQDNASKKTHKTFFDISTTEDSESTALNESGHLEADLVAAIKAINKVFGEADTSLSMSISKQEQSLNQSSIVTDPDESTSVQSSSYVLERKPSLKIKSKSKKSAGKRRKQSLRRSDSSLANASALGNDDSKVYSIPSKFKNVDSNSASGNTSQIIDVPEAEERQAPTEAEISKPLENKSDLPLSEDDTDTHDSSPSNRSVELALMGPTTEEKRFIPWTERNMLSSTTEENVNAESDKEIVDQSSAEAEEDIDSDKDGESEKVQVQQKPSAALAPATPEKADIPDSTGSRAPIALNKFRVKLGYSDSEGSSDLSEIGGTVPISLQPTPGHSAERLGGPGPSESVSLSPNKKVAIHSNLAAPKADLDDDDDFFDF